MELFNLPERTEPIMRQLKITPQITDRSEKSFEKYLTDVHAYPPKLSHEQEVEAGNMVQSGDEETKQKGVDILVKHNLRFVISVAKQYHAQSTYTLGDLVNAGNMGLITAAQRFDPTRGFKFISYAVWWIRQSIMQSLSDEGRTIRLPSNQHAKLSKVKDAERNLQQRFGREPSIDELRQYMVREEVKKLFLKEERDINTQVFEDEVTKALKKEEDSNFKLELLTMYATKPTSIDSYVSDEEREKRVSETMESEGLEDFSNHINNFDLRGRILAHMEKLDAKERNILLSIFGIDGREAKSLDELSEEYEVGPERIRQLRERAIKKLRSSKSFMTELEQFR